VSVHKANRFIRAAKAGGWSTKYQILSKANQAIQVVATRGPEKIVIEWANNQLAYSPEYHLHDMQLKIHSRLDAERRLALVKPDMEQYRKWQQRSRNSSKKFVAEDLTPEELQELQEDILASLPFDIKDDSDATILKAIRGNTLVFRNSISGTVETCHVPFRSSDGKVFNYDTENVFFLADNEEGRSWLSFMDANGCFRAVHLDRLIAVV
jgi:hypothetical protein